MTDRERLLVAALSRGGDELPNPVTSLELMAMLEELGTDQRRTLGNPHAHLTARTPARILGS